MHSKLLLYFVCMSRVAFAQLPPPQPPTQQQQTQQQQQQANLFLWNIYPPLNQVPPINQSWSDAILSNKNITDTPAKTGLPMIDPTLGVKNCIDRNMWALTFDGGPTDNTWRILDELGKRNIKATFFVTGSQVRQNDNILRAMHNQGHQIGISSWSNSLLTSLTNDQIVAEIGWTAKLIRDVTGVTPMYFRPPWGDINLRVREIAQSFKLTTVTYSYTSLDTVSDVSAYQEMTLKAMMPHDGVISLQHDWQRLIPTVFDNIASTGYSFQRIDTCTQLRPAYDPNILWTAMRIQSNFGNGDPRYGSTGDVLLTKGNITPNSVTRQSANVFISIGSLLVTFLVFLLWATNCIIWNRWINRWSNENC